MERNRLIEPYQVAFKTGRGGSVALLNIDFYITKALSSRNHVTILFIDIEHSTELEDMSSWKFFTNGKLAQRCLNSSVPF